MRLPVRLPVAPAPQRATTATRRQGAGDRGHGECNGNGDLGRDRRRREFGSHFVSGDSDLHRHVGRLQRGATVDVAITISQEQNVILIPAFAVTTTNGVSTVVVSNNGKDETRTVTTGQTSGAEIAITSGLKAGEQVVITFPGAGGFGNGQGRGAGGAGG